MSKNKFFADDGWAFWIDGDDTSTVYLNEWVNPKGRNYVDIGIRIKGVLDTRKLSIYVPFSVTTEEIEDISLRLKEERFLYAIFSTTCLMDFKKNVCTSEIAYNAKTIDLVHISETGFEISPLASGSLITVPLDAIRQYLDNDEAYFLFRIPHKSLDDVFTSKVTVRDALERLQDLVSSPLVSERYGYSVRINESRMLPSEITRLGAFHRQKLNKAVVTISLSEEYELMDSNCYRIRRLEENLYRDYVPADYSCADVITYQWNESREDNLYGHFNFYFNISHEAVSKKSVLIYMLLILFIGIAGCSVWDLIKYLIGIY